MDSNIPTIDSPYPAPTLQDVGLDGGGWCFQSAEEQREIIQLYALAKCGDPNIVKKFAEEIPWLFTSKGDDDSSSSNSKDEL